jgi:hypothetical protein
MAFRTAVTAAAILAAAVLGGCSSAEKPLGAVAAAPEGAPGPLALAPRKGAPQTIAMPANPELLAKAVERLRITKKKGESPFEQAGADLNSDGRAKAIVLLTGADWCSPQGCTLAIFEPAEVGFKLVSQTIGVRAPVAAGPGSNAGWRDLIVKTGASKIVRLQFTGGGYPSNAAGQPDAAAEAQQAEILIPAPGSQAVAANLPQTEPGPR